MNYTIYPCLVAISFCLLMPTGEKAARAANANDERHSPHAAVQPVSLNAVEWTDGFWADRIESVHKRSIPAMWEIMKGTKYKPFYQNFLVAAGDAKGDFHGAQWNDGDFYKFLEAVCGIYATTHD